MARRKRKEDVPIWEPPEFDEVGYMRKEMENAKISIVVIAWAIVGSLLFYLFFALNLAVVGFLLGLLIFGALYFLLPMLGLPIHGFKRRDWASHAMVYFFSWLAFTILIMNAPFGDHTNPVIGSFEVGTFQSNSTVSVPPPNSMGCFAVRPETQVNVPASSNNTFYVLFRATDNVAVRNVTAKVGGSNVTPVNIAGKADVCAGAANPTFPPDTYSLTFQNSGAASYTVVVTAIDTSGLPATAWIQIQSP